MVCVEEVSLVFGRTPRGFGCYILGYLLDSSWCSAGYQTDLPHAHFASCSTKKCFAFENRGYAAQLHFASKIESFLLQPQPRKAAAGSSNGQKLTRITQLSSALQGDRHSKEARAWAWAWARAWACSYWYYLSMS